MRIQLQPAVNGVSEAMLEACRGIAVGRSVTRNDHNLWLDTELSEGEVETFCIDNNLIFQIL